MYLFDAAAESAPGDELFHPADPGQPAGRVAAAAPRPEGGGCSLLAELKLAAHDGGVLHLRSPDGPALVQENHAVTDPLGEVHVVGCEQDGGSGQAEQLQALDQVELGAVVEREGGLIQQQD